MSGLLELVEILPQTKIESLWLGGNNLTTEAERALKDAVEYNKAAKEGVTRSHSLRDNRLTKKAEQALKDAAGSSVDIVF